MNRLIEIGFKKACRIIVEDGKLVFSLGGFAKEKPVMYAFVEKNRVLYIGKSKNSLNDRLGGYRNASPSQKTNTRIRNLLVERIASGRAISVYFMSGYHPETVGVFKISLPAGLEDDIILQLDPDWNDL